MDINRLEAPQYGRLDVSTEQADTGASLSSGAAGGMQTRGYSVEFDHPALVGQFLQDIGPMPAGNSTGDPFALQGSSVDQALGASNAEDASNPWVPHVANVLDGPEVDWDSLMNELGFVE
ncbi:hypothetical protein FRC17_006247 [Serendipita sp. 399]|nr:hypothetical protein FRC17_006247 [Serendipita sp. 399]